MPSKKLTKRTLDALEAGPERYFVWDTERKGFGVRASPPVSPGAPPRRVFVLKYRPPGSLATRLLTIGAFGPLTVDQARRQAEHLLHELSLGRDPLTTKGALRQAPTVAELAVRYLDDVAKRKKPSTAKGYTWYFRQCVLPTLGSMKVAQVTRADVGKLHREMASTPYNANRTLAILGAFFAFAEREGERPAASNPARGIPRYAEHGRERFLTADEFGRLGAALRTAELTGLPPVPPKSPRPALTPDKAKHQRKDTGALRPANPQAIACLRLLLLTGCREGEILTLRWDAVDLERGQLRLADTKTGKSVRPLGKAAAALLGSLPRRAGSPYVFAGAKPGTPLREINHVWKRVRYAAGLTDVRLHDLRHSVASVSAVGGDSLLVIRAILGHAHIATTAKYAHLADDPLRAAADRVSTDIAGMLDGTPPQKKRASRRKSPSSATRAA